VTATTADPNSTNNSATANGTIVGPPADLAVTASGPATASEGDPVTYTVTVTNTDAASSGTGVVLTDTLGANLKYVSVTASQGTFSQSGGVVTFNLGALTPNSSATVTVTALAYRRRDCHQLRRGDRHLGRPQFGEQQSDCEYHGGRAGHQRLGPIIVSGKNQNNVAVATFAHAAGVESTGAFNAVINWGDGKTSIGTITLSGTTYTVRGRTGTTRGTRTRSPRP